MRARTLDETAELLSNTGAKVSVGKCAARVVRVEDRVMLRDLAFERAGRARSGRRHFGDLVSHFCFCARAIAPTVTERPKRAAERAEAIAPALTPPGGK
eukprot:15479474-Alexandrium_andersonii.AAC.1